jgi:hypothetical protein
VRKKEHIIYGACALVSEGIGRWAAVREARKAGTPGAVDALPVGYRSRMNNLSLFMKEVLQIYT